jgi:diadenosine tetraphosphate (Ap4A) HIT family hydrolase
MPETASDWYARVSAAIDADGYRPSSWPDWPTWPFDGELTTRPLAAPGSERPRAGEGGVGCFMCEKSRGDDPAEYVVWRDEVAMIGVPLEGSALPFGVFLMPRRHADLSDLTPAEAARLGELLVYAERAAVDVLDIPRIQVARWGDGQEHLHWWLTARPTGMEQLHGTFLSHWDDLLPLPDPAAARADLELVAARLVELTGGEVLSGLSG